MRFVAEELRGVLLARKRAHRQDSVSIDQPEGDGHTACESLRLRSDDERRILVSDDHPGSSGEAAERASGLVNVPGKEELVTQSSGIRVPAVFRDPIEDEGVDPVVRRRVIGAEGFVNHHREAGLVPFENGKLQPEVSSGSSRSLCPVEDVFASSSLRAAGKGQTVEKRVGTAPGHIRPTGKKRLSRFERHGAPGSCDERERITSVRRGTKVSVFFLLARRPPF
jgi:hypothetical protein